MRVLVAHNQYRSDQPSGENAVVANEIALLREAGHEVTTLMPSSDEIAGRPLATLGAAAGPLYSRRGVRALERHLRDDAPDVVHVHNVFPLLSPWVVRTAAAAGIPVVQTVHNYRHTCVNGLHLRDERVCTDCLDHRLPWPAVAHGCYRGSRLQSVPMASSQVLHRSTWRDDVSRFIVLTPFQRDWLVRAGVDAAKTVLRPTWVPDPGHTTAPRPGADALFVGRLSQEKGIELLLDGWAARSDRQRRLTIIGDGDLAPLVRQRAELDDTITYLGRRDAAGVAEAMAASGVVILPSVCLEGFPLVIAEAFAHGRPVLTVTGGAPASIVTPDVGWVADCDPQGVARTLDLLPHDTAAWGAAARVRYDAENSPGAALASLEAVYASVV